jgi:hypothetical protein
MDSHFISNNSDHVNLYSRVIKYLTIFKNYFTTLGKPPGGGKIAPARGNDLQRGGSVIYHANL